VHNEGTRRLTETLAIYTFISEKRDPIISGNFPVTIIQHLKTHAFFRVFLSLFFISEKRLPFK